MPIKISKRSKKTKGKGKVSQSQQVIVNIQKGKRKASSQPVSRPSQAPIIIQQPQQDYSVLENLFKQYSTTRSVAEPKPVMMGMETQTETPIKVEKQTQIKETPINLEEQQRLREKLAEIEGEKPIPIKKRPVLPVLPVRGTAPLPVRGTAPLSTPDKVVNPLTNRLINKDSPYYKKLVREGKIKPE